MKSRLGSRMEYVAFLGVLIKILVAEGWDVETAWDAVCNDSSKLGHYATSEDAKNQLEPTGSRKIGEFYDLANTYKILAMDDEEIDERKGFWLAGGAYNAKGKKIPIGYIGYYYYPDYCYEYGVGWIVFE